MKAMIIRFACFLLFVFFAAKAQGIAVIQLVAWRYLVLVIAGTVIMTILDVWQNHDKSHWRRTAGNQAILVSFVVAFLAIFSLVSGPLDYSNIRQEVLMCMRPILYGLMIRILCGYEKPVKSSLKDAVMNANRQEAEEKKQQEEPIKQQEEPVKHQETSVHIQEGTAIQKDKQFICLKEAGLSKRECEIAALIIDGMSNQEIADELYLTENTVKKHNANLFKKLQINNREQIKQLYRK